MMKRKFEIGFILVIAIVSLGFMSNNIVYILDKGHTHIGFEVERFLVGEVTGRFNDFSAGINMEGDDYSTLKMSAVIKVNSLDSNNETRDGHLRGEMWLNAEKHPEITFISSQVNKQTNGSYVMTGNLTIKGITNNVEFPIEILGPFKDPTQREALGIKANFSINRFDYGVQFNKKMDNGLYFIGDKVNIKIRALAYKE